MCIICLITLQHECKNEADKFLEYERNLKILNILLCFSSIYRHIFFNLDSIKRIKEYCLVLTSIYVFFIYCHEIREKRLSGAPSENITMNQEPRNLQILSMIDTQIAIKTIISLCSYIFTVIILTYLIKKLQFMRRNQ